MIQLLLKIQKKMNTNKQSESKEMIKSKLIDVHDSYRSAVPLNDCRSVVQTRSAVQTRSVMETKKFPIIKFTQVQPLIVGNKTSNPKNVMGEIVDVEFDPKCVAPDEWKEGVDRFSNFVVKKNFTKEDIIAAVLKILQTLKLENYKSLEDIFTYLQHPEANSLICKIAIDEYMTCEFSITLYAYQKGTKEETFMLDIQELCGEHLTFSEFLEHFKRKLHEQQIWNRPTYTQEFMKSFGLDLDICLKVY